MKLHHYYWLFIIFILSGSYLKGELASGLIFVGGVSLTILVALTLWLAMCPQDFKKEKE